MGLDCIVNLPFLPILLWFLPYAFSCRRSFYRFVDSTESTGRFWSFSIDGCSANSCDFGVLVRGGELRVFLLHHLVPPSHASSVFLFIFCLLVIITGRGVLFITVIVDFSVSHFSSIIFCLRYLKLHY